MKWMRATALALVVISASGCAVNRYQVPIGYFRAHVDNGVGVLGEFYRTRNAYERDLYLLGVAADPDQSVARIDADGNPTPLATPTFSEESIRARLDALQLVAIYADQLAELAGSEAPARFQDASILLGQNLNSLSATFGRLSGAADPTASRYTEPITALIGAIGKMILEGKRDRLIAEAIRNGSPEVDVILAQIRDDLDTIFAPQISTGQALQVAELMFFYNANRQNMTFDQRHDFLSKIAAAIEGGQAAVVSSPSILVTAIIQAHQALVQFANSPRKPANFAALNNALAELAARIEAIAAEIQTLRRP